MTLRSPNIRYWSLNLPISSGGGRATIFSSLAYSLLIASLSRLQVISKFENMIPQSEIIWMYLFVIITKELDTE